MQSSVGMLYEQQKRLQEQLTSAMHTNPISGMFADAAKRNVEMWQRMQETLMKSSGLMKPQASATKEEPPLDD